MIGIIQSCLSLVWMVGHSHTPAAGFWVAAPARVSAFGSLRQCFPHVKQNTDYMIHQYGSTDDWAEMAKITGDPGWNWDNVKQYIKRVMGAYIL